MLQLQKLSVVQFKNVPSGDFSFSPGLNALVGHNGVGKTNVLDAIYYLSFTKSYFQTLDGQNIAHGRDFFRLEGDFLCAGREEQIVCAFERGRRKIFKKNQKPYRRFSDHIGRIPLVIISPYDQDLIREGGETRRKFIDGVIAQSDPSYLEHLMRYNQLLGHRNALLKQFAAAGCFQEEHLAIYDEEMAALGGELSSKRRAFIADFTPVFQSLYAAVSNRREAVNLTYRSQLNPGDSLRELLVRNRDRDRRAQHTTKGIHRDDLEFSIADHPVKKTGSQGQQKSFLIALKLAQFQLMQACSGLKPLLLLDDIFDKLDAQRVEQLVHLVNDDFFGQVFLSDTHRERVESIANKINMNCEIFSL